MVKGRRSADDEHIDDEPAAKVPRTVKTVKALLPIPELPQLSGALLAAGSNEVGQLGLDEDITEKTRPAAIANAKDVVAISAGGMHSIYLNTAGEVYSFGCNDEGALGRDTSEGGGGGTEYDIRKVELPDRAVRVSTGDSHTACLLSDGRVFAWGSFRDSHGAMGLTLEGNKRFPIEVVPLVTFVDIASGADHLVLLSNAGKVYTIGCAEQGQLGRVTARSSGGESRRGKTHLLQPGQIFFAKGKFIDAIYATTYCTFLREQNTGIIFAFGLNNYTQLGLAGKKKSELMFVPRLTAFKDVHSIAGGQHHTLMVSKDHKCLVVGRKDYGRLGLGQVDSDVAEPTLVAALADKNVVEVSCGETCSFAVTDDGKVYAWGMASNQLGVGSEDDDLYEPVLLTGQQIKDKKVIAVNGGGQHTLFMVQTTNTTTAGAVAALKATADATNTVSKTNGNTAVKGATVAAKKTNNKKK